MAQARCGLDTLTTQPALKIQAGSHALHPFSSAPAFQKLAPGTVAPPEPLQIASVQVLLLNISGSVCHCFVIWRWIEAREVGERGLGLNVSFLFLLGN